MEKKENYIGFWSACMLLQAVLLIGTAGIAVQTGIGILSSLFLKLAALEVAGVMGGGIILIERRRRYLKKNRNYILTQSARTVRSFFCAIKKVFRVQ